MKTNYQRRTTLLNLIMGIETICREMRKSFAIKPPKSPLLERKVRLWASSVTKFQWEACFLKYEEMIHAGKHPKVAARKARRFLREMPGVIIKDDSCRHAFKRNYPKWVASGRKEIPDYRKFKGVKRNEEIPETTPQSLVRKHRIKQRYEKKQHELRGLATYELKSKLS